MRTKLFSGLSPDSPALVFHQSLFKYFHLIFEFPFFYFNHQYPQKKTETCKTPEQIFLLNIFFRLVKMNKLKCKFSDQIIGKCPQTLLMLAQQLSGNSLTFLAELFNSGHFGEFNPFNTRSSASVLTFCEVP